MAAQDDTPNGAPCWIDLMSSDPERARAFYGELFGWTSEEPDPKLGGYFNFAQHGRRVAGGLPTMPGAPVTDVWSVYLACADARETVTRATAGGAQVMVPAMDVVDLGTMAVVVGPDGGVVGMWQPGSHRGFGALGAAGKPRWFELLSRDYEAAVGFYRDVFGWQTEVVSDEPGFRLTALANGTQQEAAIMDGADCMPEDVPSHWAVYFAVEDTDRALATIRELGGSVLEAARDTPFGRTATAADPMGGRFKLVAGAA
jgi:predicted enzyme related to lactoylglutathione lyase